MRHLSTALFLALIVGGVHAQPICNANGNLLVYSNYDGGSLTINVDQNIPDLRIGICTYRSVAVTITGPFAGNVTGVIYAGYDQPNNTCGGAPPSTTITGVPAGIVTAYSPTTGNTAVTNFLGEVTQAVPGVNLVNCMIGAEGFCSASATGGGNSAPQIVQFFLAEFGPGTTLRSHQTQGGCFSSTFTVSAGGNCCLTNTGTPPNPVYTGNGGYDVFPVADTTLCGASLTLDASFYTGGYTTTWSTGATVDPITISTPGTYTVTITGYCITLFDTVEVLPCCEPVVVTAVMDPIACAGGDDGSITVTPLGQNGPYTFAWNAAPPQGSPTITGLGPGTYSVVVADSAGCDTTLSFALAEPPPLVVQATGEPFLCPGQAGSFSAAAQGGTGTIELSWSTGATGAAIEQAFGSNAELVATATDAAGCVATDTLRISVPTRAEGPFVPNVFSPNGDGINDVFAAAGIGDRDGSVMRIFDRWGLEVFATNDASSGWNGRGDQGTALPAGVYMFLIEVDDPCLGAGAQQLRGHVTLLR